MQTSTQNLPAGKTAPLVPAYRTVGTVPIPVQAPRSFVPTPGVARAPSPQLPDIQSPRPNPVSPRVTVPRPPVTSPRAIVVPPVASPRTIVVPPPVASPRTIVVPPPVASPRAAVVPPPVRLTVVAPPPTINPAPKSVTSPRTIAIPPPPNIRPTLTVVGQPPIVSPVLAVLPQGVVYPTAPPPVTETEEPEVEELVLRPRQMPWAESALDILMSTHGVLDTSKMGSGKTFTTLWLAKQLNLRILVISLVILEDMWRTLAATYGVELIDFISYGELRSTTGHQPKHGYLIRRDQMDGNKKFVSFIPTQAYLDLVQSGIMVICDEIDKIKNNSGQYRAAAAMLHPVIAPGSISRFMLLSALPFDKEEHSINLLRLIGYIRHPRLYTYVGRPPQLRLEGLQELIDAANFIDADKTQAIMAEVPLIKSMMTKLVYRLYSEVILERIAGSMPPPDIDAAFDAKNGFYNILPANVPQLMEGIAMLAKAVGYEEGAANVQIRAETIGTVTTALVKIETAKSYDIARVARDILAANSTGKVVISVNYTDTLDYLRRALADHDPIILYGDVPRKRRHVLVADFNTNPFKRLLIMNTAVGGHGISLHDTVGGSPRFMLLSPSYKLLDISQATGRIYRDGTVSDASVRMFYGKGVGIQETNILHALARKSNIAKGTVAGPAKDALVLPGDYAAAIEP